jgi:hypothetical protein
MTRKLMSSYTVPQNIPSGILSHFALVYRKVYHLDFTSVTYSKKNEIYTAFLCAAKVAVSGFPALYSARDVSSSQLCKQKERPAADFELVETRTNELAFRKMLALGWVECRRISRLPFGAICSL